MPRPPRFVLATHLFALLFTGSSCTSDEQTKPAATSTTPQVTTVSTATAGGVATYTPGKAGGVIEDVITASATVTAVNPATRRITLSAQDGTKATFVAPEEVRNFDRIKVGDRLNATLKEQLVVTVNEGEDPAVTHAAVLAAAPKGAKPGAMVAETFALVATVDAIDTTNRQATLRFKDGQTREVPIRQDVDLSRYNVGDRVVIRITQQLTLLVETP